VLDYNYYILIQFYLFSLLPYTLPPFKILLIPFYHLSEADARKSWYYSAIQYDTKTDSTITWIGQIKNALKGISPEADKTFKILSKLDEIDFKKFQDNNFKDFIKENELADKSLIRFLEDTNIDSKTLGRYQQYLKDTGKATSTFASITKKAGSVIKGFGAALGSMGVMWAISEAIGFVVTNIHDMATASEQAKENADSFAASANQLNENIASAIEEGIQLLPVVTQYFALAPPL